MGVLRPGRPLSAPDDVARPQFLSVNSDMFSGVTSRNGT